MSSPKRTDPPVRLSKRTVEAARPREREYILWDTDIRGFGLKVLPSGKRSYLLKYRTRVGRPRKPAIGVHGDVTADEARRIAREWHAEIAKGGDPKGERDTKRAASTFRDLAGRFIDEYARAKKRSWKEDQRILQKYFEPWHGRAANSIQPAEVADLIRSIGARHGGIMANRCLACVRKLYAWARKNPQITDIDSNPAVEVDPPGAEIERDRTYSEAEIQRLWAVFDEIETIGQIFKMLLVTGQRRNEVAGMAWSEIADDLWTIPGARTKNGRVHVVPLSTLAMEIIEGQQGQDERWVFPSTRRPGRPVVSTNKAAMRVKKLADVPDFRCHDLRRSFATECTRLGFSRFLVDRALNHVEAGVGRRYDRHDYLREKREIAEAWSRRLRNILGEGKVVQLQPGGL